MSKIKAIVILGLFVSVVMLLSCCNRGDPYETTNIRSKARQSSVQTVFHIPVIRIHYTEPLAKPEELTAEKIKEMLEKEQENVIKQINKAIEKYKENQAIDKYETSLTDLEKWGYKSKSKTFIPLGAFAPKHAKFPENILVVCKVEKKEISPWEKEYEDDVLTISETANVSPNKAKEILGNIINKGYSISKQEVKEAEEIELLYFSEWDTQWPTHLDWKVTIVGEDNNMIIGYDPRGILEVKPIPDDKMVYIKAGYFDLKDTFRKESTEVTDLKAQLETIRENLKVATETIEELKKEQADPPRKRDITQATMWDLRMGTVQMEQFFFMSAASGVFLGNMEIRDHISTWGPLRGWGFYASSTTDKGAAVILTNAHVAAQAMTYEFMVDEDRENMWVIFPGAPSIRYTKHSDYYGTPAWVMGINEVPVISDDCDAGILLSTPVPAYEQYKVKLGDSDNVHPGDPIVTVGNPMGMQKFTSEGVISNTEYSMLDALDGAYFLKWIAGNKPAYSWMLNTNFWIDCTIGIGGVSGSGIWATKGSEAGKVIAIRNAGMMQRYTRVASVQTVKESIDWDKLPDNLGGLTQDHARYLFKSLHPSAGYTESFDNFLQEHSDLANIIDKQCHGHMPISGMNIGVPINLVKAFLQERGLDPEHFGWKGLDKNYWVK